MSNRRPKQLNKYESELKLAIEDLMLRHEVNFTAFINVLRNDLPEDKSSNDYKIKYRAEYIKLLRASFTVNEVKNMLMVLGYNLVFFNDKTEIFAVPKILQDTRIKYIDLMAVCELLGITIEWQKVSIEGVENVNGNS